MKLFQVKYSLIVFLIAAIIIIIITYNSTNINGTNLYYDKEFWINILVEAHGMLLDLLLVGLIILFFILRGEKKHEIQLLKKEIDYIRLLKSDEAKFKTKALINQLNTLNTSDLDLHQCYLRDIQMPHIKILRGKIHATDFSKTTLTSSDFSKTKGEKTFFIESKLNNVKFNGCDLYRCNYKDAKMSGSFFISASILRCKFDGAVMTDTDFRNSDLSGSTFLNSQSNNCDFRNADLKDVDFTNANLQSANFRGCKNLTSAQLRKALNYKKLNVDEPIFSELK
jgi:uncharacterized protein YjbI with pentapeptide repeats